MSDNIVNFRTGFRVSDGFNFTAGVFAFFAFAMLVSVLADYIYPSGFDDSDAPPKRSGMSIRTDNLSGCQYLMSFTGSLTPRLDATGKQICTKRPSPTSTEDKG